MESQNIYLKQAKETKGLSSFAKTMILTLLASFLGILAGPFAAFVLPDIYFAYPYLGGICNALIFIIMFVALQSVLDYKIFLNAKRLVFIVLVQLLLMVFFALFSDLANVSTYLKDNCDIAYKALLLLPVPVYMLLSALAAAFAISAVRIIKSLFYLIFLTAIYLAIDIFLKDKSTISVDDSYVISASLNYVFSAIFFANILKCFANLPRYSPSNNDDYVPASTFISTTNIIQNQKDENMKCSVCSSDLSTDAAFCPKCGTAVNRQTAAITNTQNYPQGQQINVVVNQTDNFPRKSRLAYIVIGLFFGALGIHNFYAGRPGSGIFQLLITLFFGWLNIFTFWLIPGIFPLFIWVVCELIFVSKDGFGRKMR